MPSALSLHTPFPVHFHHRLVLRQNLSVSPIFPNPLPSPPPLPSLGPSFISYYTLPLVSPPTPISPFHFITLHLPPKLHLLHHLYRHHVLLLRLLLHLHLFYLTCLLLHHLFHLLFSYITSSTSSVFFYITSSTSSVFFYISSSTSTPKDTT